MHHSRDMTESMKELAQRMGLGATGQFPQGQLNQTDEGEIKLAVGLEGSKVVLNFGKPVAWVGLDADQARQLAGSLLDKARAADGKS